MIREFTCIICPNGCALRAEAEDGQVRAVSGAACHKGEEYARQEMTAPKRNIATSVLVEGGVLPLASVRLTRPIPKERIFEAMEQIKRVILKAPVQAGTVVIRGILGLDSDVIVTKTVEAHRKRRETGE